VAARRPHLSDSGRFGPRGPLHHVSRCWTLPLFSFTARVHQTPFFLSLLRHGSCQAPPPLSSYFCISRPPKGAQTPSPNVGTTCPRPVAGPPSTAPDSTGAPPPPRFQVRAAAAHAFLCPPYAACPSPPRFTPRHAGLTLGHHRPLSVARH
jgi:hypothetical protein